MERELTSPRSSAVLYPLSRLGAPTRHVPVCVSLLSVCGTTLGYLLPRREWLVLGIVESLMILEVVLQSGFTLLHLLLVTPHAHQPLVLSSFLIFANLIDVNLLIYISLVTIEIGHLFMYFVVCVNCFCPFFFLWECLSFPC